MQEMLRMTPIMVQERTQRPQILFHHDEASCIVSLLTPLISSPISAETSGSCTIGSVAGVALVWLVYLSRPDML